MGCFKRTASKHVYYQGWNRSPAQVGCMRQALGPGALGRPRGSGWRGRWEGGSGWGRHVNSRPFHFNVWQNSLQIKKKKKKNKRKKKRNRHKSIWWTILLTAKPKLVEAIWGLGRLCWGSSTWIWKIEDLPGEGKKSIPCGLNNIGKYLMGDPNSHLLCILSTQHRGEHAEDNKYLLNE